MANIEERGNPNPFHDAEGKFSTRRRAKTASFSQAGSPGEISLGKGKNGKERKVKLDAAVGVRFRPERNSLSIRKLNTAACGRMARALGQDIRCHDGQVMRKGAFASVTPDNELDDKAAREKAGKRVATYPNKEDFKESLESMFYRPMLVESALEDFVWVPGPDGEQMAETEGGEVMLLVYADEEGAAWAVYADDGDDATAEGEADSLSQAKELAGKAALAALASHGFVADPEVMEEIQSGVSLTSHLAGVLAV